MFLRLLKLNETLFALPFAYSGLLLAYKFIDDLELIKIIWITIAMVGARTFGMLMNRVIDKQIDSINPRTKDRDLPSGRVKTSSILLIAFFALIVFIYSAFMLNNMAFYLSPIVAIYMLIYSYTKRFTWLSSFFLGCVLATAPSGAWIGINGSLGFEPVILSIAVVLWATSFDILYHVQDVDFYSRNKLYSFSARFGVEFAVKITKLLDILSVLMLILLGVVAGLSWIYYIGPIIVGYILFYKHRYISYHGVIVGIQKCFRLNPIVALSIFFSIFASLIVS